MVLPWLPPFCVWSDSSSLCLLVSMLSISQKGKEHCRCLNVACLNVRCTNFQILRAILWSFDVSTFSISFCPFRHCVPDSNSMLPVVIFKPDKLALQIKFATPLPRCRALQMKIIYIKSKLTRTTRCYFWNSDSVLNSASRLPPGVVSV